MFSTSEAILMKNKKEVKYGRNGKVRKGSGLGDVVKGSAA